MSRAAFIALSGTVSRTLDVATIESMGMGVSEGSGCEYCLRSHMMLGTRLGKLDVPELELNRRGESSDPKRAAAAPEKRVPSPLTAAAAPNPRCCR